MTPTPLIGLEIHVQLKTHTKLFCGDVVAFDAAPNTNICPVCLGLPGALPMVNRAAIELALRAAIALGCELHMASSFTRKNYFYPDLPKGYQITQYEAPLATGGSLDDIPIRRVHVEEDAGKLLHDRLAGRTAIDMNRAGVPLLEIVTEPDLHTPAQARAFLVQLKRLLQYLGVSDCEMQKGSLRVDANVSLGGTPTEIKNMNSFAGLERALHAEIARQQALAAVNRPIIAETLAWNDVTGELRVLRIKEQREQYRYMVEPDLPPLRLEPARIDAIAAGLPMLPRQRAAQLKQHYGLRAQDADVLSASRALADYFEEVVALTGDARAAASWIMRDVLATANALQTEFAISAPRLAELIGLIARGELSSVAARSVFRRMCESDATAAQIVASEQLAPFDDSAQAAVWAEEILRSHPRELARYRAGEARILEFFVGKLLRMSNGRMDPRKARAIMTRTAQAR